MAADEEDGCGVDEVDEGKAGCDVGGSVGVDTLRSARLIILASRY